MRKRLRSPSSIHYIIFKQYSMISWWLINRWIIDHVGCLQRLGSPLEIAKRFSSFSVCMHQRLRSQETYILSRIPSIKLQDQSTSKITVLSLKLIAVSKPTEQSTPQSRSQIVNPLEHARSFKCRSPSDHASWLQRSLNPTVQICRSWASR